MDVPKNGSTRVETKRDNNMDLLRLLSCFAVVLIHVNAQYFIVRSTTPSFTYVYIVECTINIVARFSVPAFVMISGAFTLSKQQNSDALIFYRKSLKKIFLPLAPAIFLFAEYDMIVKNVDLGSILESLVNGSYYNLWFMFMLLCLYALVPVLIRLKAILSWRWWGRLGFALLIWAIVSQATSSYELSYDIGIASSFLGYFISGSFLRENYNKLKLPSPYVCTVEIFLLVIATFLVRYSGFNFYSFDAYRSFFSPSIVAISLLTFVIFCNIHVHVNLKKFATLTYYVYIFHTLIYSILMQYFGSAEHELRTIALVFVLTIAISFLVAKLYSNIWCYLGRTPFMSPTIKTRKR